MADPRVEPTAEALYRFEGGEGAWTIVSIEDADHYFRAAEVAIATVDGLLADSQDADEQEDPRVEPTAEALYRFEGGEVAWTRIPVADAEYYCRVAEVAIETIDALAASAKVAPE